MKDNFKFILKLFFGIFYFMPIFLEVFFYSDMSSLYRLNDNSVVLVIIFIFILLSFSVYKFKVNQGIFNFFFINIFKGWIVISSSVIFLVLSSYFYINYNVKFRHTGENVTDVGGWMIILITLRAYFKAFLFYVFIARFKNIPLRINRVILLNIAICFSLSMVSSLDIALIIFSILLFLNQIKLFIRRHNTSFELFTLVRNGILSLALFSSIVFFGIANKVGTETAKTLVFDKDVLRVVIVSTGLRLSTYYASIHGVLNVVGKQENNLSSGFFGAIHNTINRGVYLTTGEELARPEVWTIYRANYENLFVYNTNDRTGASPGIIASVFYGPNVVFGIMIIMVYLSVICNILKWAFSFTYTLNSLGLILALVFVMPFLESPMDLVNVFNPSFIYIYAVLGGLLSLKNVSINYVR